jgi:tRNA(Ile)-lysidine synthase
VRITSAGFENAVAAALGEYAGASVYLAAVSGGADSMAMLAALAALMRDRHQLSDGILRCIHVEHGIRPHEESVGDAAYVRQFCDSLNIPCRIVTIPPGKIAAVAREKGIGIEASARLFRHRALLREARRLEAAGKTVGILIAHTRTDALETTLMRLLRGAGPEGLAAMPRRRGRIIRPLLQFERDDVLSYLREKNISWREDASNEDTRFLRNRIRRCLVPLLNEQFPGWHGSLDAVSHTQRLAADFISGEALACVPWQRGADGAFFTEADAFFSQPAIIREEALFRGIDALLENSAATAAVRRAVVRRFCTGHLKAADLGAARAVCGNGRIQLKKTGARAFEEGFSLLIKEPGLYTLKGVTVEVTPGFNSNDAGEAAFPVLLPLVLRRTLKDDWIIGNGKKIAAAKAFNARQRKRLLSAIDRRGTRAFLEPGGLPLINESGAAQGECYTVTIQRTHSICSTS